MTKGTILLAEDDPGSRAVVSKLLEKAGYTVRTAEDGEKARAILDGHDRGSIDFLVTDILMPGLNGIDLIAYMKETNHPLYQRGAIAVSSAITGIREHRNRLTELGITKDQIITKVGGDFYKILIARIDAEFHRIYSPLKVLVVEDNDTNYAPVEVMLKKRGYVSVRAKSVSGAIAALQGGDIFYVFTDIDLNHGGDDSRSGIDLLDALRGYKDANWNTVYNETDMRVAVLTNSTRTEPGMRDILTRLEEHRVPMVSKGEPREHILSKLITDYLDPARNKLYKEKREEFDRLAASSHQG